MIPYAVLWTLLSICKQAVLKPMWVEAVGQSSLMRRACKLCHTQMAHLITTSPTLRGQDPLSPPPLSSCSSPPITYTSYHYFPIWRGLCIKPFDSTKYAEALSKAIGQPHVAPDVPYIRAIVHAAGRAGSILKNGYNTYGPLLFALALEVLLIQPHHPYVVSRRANIYLLSTRELHVLL